MPAGQAYTVTKIDTSHSPLEVSFPTRVYLPYEAYEDFDEAKELFFYSIHDSLVEYYNSFVEKLSAAERNKHDLNKIARDVLGPVDQYLTYLVALRPPVNVRKEHV